jgi:hypothetical protein
MTTICKLAVGVFAAVVCAGAALAQDTKNRTIEQFTCKDVMRDNGEDREVAIAFLHGFLLGKSGSSSFNLDALHKQTDAFIERCLDNPAEKAMDAMLKVKS